MFDDFFDIEPQLNRDEAFAQLMQNSMRYELLGLPQ